jgi:hypothetical protein
MNALRILGALMLVLGLAFFVTGGFRVASDSAVDSGAPLALDRAQTEQTNIDIPQWISLGTMVLGGMVLVVGFRRV